MVNKIEIKKYIIQTINNCDIPNVEIKHIKGEHPINYWNGSVDLNMCKINFFIEGQAHIIVREKPYAVGSGDIMIYLPHDIHYGNIPFNQNIEYYQIQFEPEALNGLAGGDRLIELFTDRNYNIVQMHPDANNYRCIKDSFEKLFSCMENQDAFQNIRALSLVMEILVQINRCQEFNVIQLEYGFYPEVLIKSIKFINDNYQNAITTGQISDAVFVSRTYLNKLFQKYLNMSIHKYILCVQISKACSYLCEGLNVTETAMMVGFQSSTSFAGAFKRICKISPSQFRRQYYKK